MRPRRSGMPGYGVRVSQYAPPPQQPSGQHPAQPHAAAQYSAPQHPAAQAQAQGRPRRTFAIIAAVVAALEVLLGPLQAIVTASVLRGGDFNPTIMGVLSLVFGIASGVLALVAIALGIVSAVRREQLRLLAGAAIGVGAAGIVGLISVLLQTAAYSAL